MLRHALAPLVGQSGQAFGFSSVTKQKDTAASDIELLVVSDALGYGEVSAALDGARHILARSINPVLYSDAEFQRRLQGDNAFVISVMQQPKILLIGDHVPSQDGLILDA